MNPTAFRNKPVEIEAFQMTEERRRDNSEWPSWLHEAWNKESSELGAVSIVDYPASDKFLQITTEEGLAQISWGDWIVKEANGALYAYKPEVFELTFEAAPASHEDRVRKEKEELDAKGAKLSDFIYDNPIFQGLPAEEQERLNRQYSVMSEYSQVLAERIAAFPA